MKEIQITFKVNGKNKTILSNPNRSLLDILREDLGLTGAKDACGGEGECGACTVIMDGKPINSCLVLAGQVDGHTIETIEGLAHNEELNYIQKSYIDAGAVQCGYCTPGLIMSTKALLDRNPNPDEKEIREGISGNICRCTGYVKIIDAVKKASEIRQTMELR